MLLELINAVYFMFAAAAFMKMFYNHKHSYNLPSKLLFVENQKHQSIYSYAAAVYSVLILGLSCLATRCCFCNATTKTPINKDKTNTTCCSLFFFYIDNICVVHVQCVNSSTNLIHSARTVCSLELFTKTLN